MIDKIIRQRARKGPFGADYSFLVNENQLIEEKDIRIQRMVDGLSWLNKDLNMTKYSKLII